MKFTHEYEMNGNQIVIKLHSGVNFFIGFILWNQINATEQTIIIFQALDNYKLLI